MSRIDNTHECPRPGCERRVPYRQLACPDDWALVSPAHKREVYAAYKSGEVLRHLAAMSAAVADMGGDPPFPESESTCPICKRHWTVTIADDCMLPACGHYGHDTSAANPDRPCESCGLHHAWNCLDMPGRLR